MAKVMIEMAHPSTYMEEVFKYAIDNKVKTISFAEDELEYIYEQLKGYHDGYAQGKKDRDNEIAEHSVFYSNKPIEDIVLEARADERENVLDQALSYCNLNNDDKEECWNCCLSTWKDGMFEGCYLEQLKEQKNE